MIQGDQRILNKLAAYRPDAYTYRPFVATFEMSSPVCLAHPWINGDALIASQLMRHILGDDFYTLPTKRVLPINDYLELPLEKSYDVWHASASVFDIDDVFLTTIYKRFDSQNTDIVNNRKKKIPLGAGFFKGCMIRQPYTPSRTIKFFFNGDMEMCSRLLQHVPALGKDRSRGFGVVKSLSVEPCSEDYSLFKDGIVMRPIPALDIKHMGIPEKSIRSNYKPPYWNHGKAVMCAVPGTKMIVT